MSKLNKGIILEDCLISFLLLSTYLLLMSALLSDVYRLNREIEQAHLQVNQLKSCGLNECELSTGNNVRSHCQVITIKSRSENVCIQI